MLNLVSDYVVPKIFIDQPKVSYDKYKKVKPLFDELGRWGSTIEELSVENPGTWLSTFDRVIDKVVESPKFTASPVMEFLRSINSSWFSISKNLEFFVVDVYKKERFEIVKNFEDAKVAKVDVPMDVYLQIDKQDAEDNPQDYIPEMFIPRDQHWDAIRELGDIFWEERECVFLDENGDDFTISNHVFDNDEYYGETSHLVDLWGEYIEQSVRRVIILQGIPGTGKSTLCAYASKKLSERTLVLGQNFTKRIDMEGWREMIQGLNPTLVIVDDIDRLSYPVLENILPMFEESFYKVPLTLFTTNNEDKMPPAFKRPGRVDQIIEMPEPPRNAKYDMIYSFCDDVGISSDEIPDKNVEDLIEVYEKIPSGAFVKELLRRYKVEGFEYEIPEFDLTFERITNDSSSSSHEALGGGRTRSV